MTWRRTGGWKFVKKRTGELSDAEARYRLLKILLGRRERGVSSYESAGCGQNRDLRKGEQG